MRENLPLPEAIQNAPDLEQGLELYYLGFLDLIDDRQFGLSLGGIPWTAINAYCKSMPWLDEFQVEAMHYHIKQLDGAYVKHKNKKK